MNSDRDYSLQNRSPKEITMNREKLYELFENRPMPVDELLVNLGLYMRSGALAKLLYIDELYRKIRTIPGVIMEFGTWWGENVILFENLRAIYEPYNYSRRVIAFDTFVGYLSVSDKDLLSNTIKLGGYSVSENYKSYLDSLINYHENENVMSHIKKHSVIQGDASKTIKEYLRQHPETIIAMANFDMALYEPTKACLEAIKPHLIRGSIVAMDEINSADYPGETVALVEALGLRTYRIQRSTYLPDRSFLIVD